MTRIIHFVGAGPGDPELITLKGNRLLQEADLVVYAGSLVNPCLLERVQPHCVLRNSAEMTLEEICDLMIEFARADRKVVRLQSGDPGLYGALREQMALLGRAGVPYAMVPGVSSFAAAAAALGREYTLPEIAQTVILTRLAGRTPVPAGQELGALARHGASLVVFLSAALIDGVVQELRLGYDQDTPAAVVYRASWEDEKVIEGTVGDIAGKVKAAGINKTALILVGPFLGDPVARSRLYDQSFSHGCRQASHETGGGPDEQ